MENWLKLLNWRMNVKVVLGGENYIFSCYDFSQKERENETDRERHRERQAGSL